MDKEELKTLLFECGMTAITDVERDFAFGVISFFTRRIDKKTFLDWVNVIPYLNN